MKHYSERITIDPKIRFGCPTIKGMRISVYDILGWFASGMTQKEILEDYPELTGEDKQAALLYTANREHKIIIAA
jgi:uncharacterized protein (DUF433 family)